MTTTFPRAETLTRAAGLLAGLALAAAVLWAWRVEPGPGGHAVGMRLTVVPIASGELGVERAGPFLEAADMTPRRPATGALAVVNQTAAPLPVRMRAQVSTTDLDDQLWVLIAAGGQTLFRGTLGELRAWTPGKMTLRAGERRTLRARAWLAASANGYQGHAADVSLELGVRNTR